MSTHTHTHTPSHSASLFIVHTRQGINHSAMEHLALCPVDGFFHMKIQYISRHQEADAQDTKTMQIPFPTHILVFINAEYAMRRAVRQNQMLQHF